MVHAGNVVGSMLRGKVISRAARGHLLVSAALNTMLIEDVYDVQVKTNEVNQHPSEPDPPHLSSEEHQSSADPELQVSVMNIVSCQLKPKPDV